jgi:hypothetical protein
MEGTNKINKTLRRRNNKICDKYIVKENENVDKKDKNTEGRKEEN